MTIRQVRSCALAAIVASATTAERAEAQGQAPDRQFNGTIAVPIDFKNLHPEVDRVVLNCKVTPAGQPENKGIDWTDAIGTPFLNVTGGSASGTLTYHFTAHRAGTFVRGETWSYECHALVGQKGGNNTAYIAIRDNPSWPEYARLASGSAIAKGTFTLQ